MAWAGQAAGDWSGLGRRLRVGMGLAEGGWGHWVGRGWRLGTGVDWADCTGSGGLEWVALAPGTGGDWASGWGLEWAGDWNVFHATQKVLLRGS